MLDPHNAKEHYQSFIRKKNTKSLKTIKNNYLSTKNLNIVEIKLVIIEHPKTSYKLSKTIRQAR